MVTNLKAAWQSTEILTTTYDYKVLEKLQTTKAGSKAVYYKPSRLVTANKYSSFFTRLKIILSLCFFSSSSTLKFRIALKQLKEIKETAQGLQQRAKAIHQQAFILNGGQAHKDQFFKALHEFEELLADDLKTGRVIVAQESLDISYPNFYILKDKAKIVLAPRDYHEWKQQYRQIINRAFLKQTLSKKSEWERTYAANVLLQQLYKVTIQQKDKRYLVEKQALEALVHDESLMCLPLYDFAKQVEETKLTAWLKACGITDDAAIRAHKNIIHELENYYQQLEKKSECIKSHLPDISWLAKVAPKQYQFILNSYQNQILRINKRILRHFIHKVWKNPETAQLFSLSSDQEHSTQLVHLSRRF